LRAPTSPPGVATPALPAGGCVEHALVPAPQEFCLNTAEDTALACETVDRCVTEGGVTRIIGQVYGNVETGTRDVVGVLVGPVASPPNVYSNCGANLGAAITERIDKKQRKCAATKEDRNKVGNMVRLSMNHSSKVGLFSKKKVEAWADEQLHWLDCKSKKWSETRLFQSLDSLSKVAFPKFDLAASVKLESMEEGKAPRMLLADRDAGQLMSLLVIKAFEELLFSHFEGASIKHTSKRKAVRRILKRLKKKGACLVEGDGSAWDTTCGPDVRAACEDTILFHIMQILIQKGLAPSCWLEAHQAVNTAPELRAFFKKKFDKFKVHIVNIRRSGHRGTSCLNFWVNFVMWACSVSSTPEMYLDEKVRWTTDVTGTRRWWAGGFEGDDSLCALLPPMVKGDELSEKFEAFWKRWGFNMKLVYVNDRATFVGMHIACSEGEQLCTNTEIVDGVKESVPLICPELPRALKGAGISCSVSVRDAAAKGDLKTVKKLAGATAISRARDFAGILPTVSKKYLQYGLELTGKKDFEENDMSMRVFGEQGHTTGEVVEEVEALNGDVTPSEEMDNLLALGYGCTSSELDRFSMYAWDFDNVTDFNGFKESLPEAWRGKAP